MVYIINSNRKEIRSKLTMKRKSTLLLKSATDVKVIYQTRKTVFDHISKRVENTTPSGVLELPGVQLEMWSNTVLKVS